MALVVESGTGSSTADAYWSQANVLTYHTDRNQLGTGTDLWDSTLTSDQLDAAIRRGAAFIDARIRLSAKGRKLSSTQALVFPRTGINDEDGFTVASDSVPLGVRQAMAEASRTVTTTQGVSSAQSIKRVKAGSVEVEFGNFKVSRKVLSMIDELLAPYMRAGGRRG